MKKILILLVVASAAMVIFISCAQEKTYALDVSSVSGTCIEVTTSDSGEQDAFAAAGYKEGTCPSDDVLGTCKDYSKVGEVSVDAIFYSTSGLTADTAKSACELLKGTWEAK